MTITVMLRMLVVSVCILLWSYGTSGKPVPSDNTDLSATNDIESKSLGFLISKGYLSASSPWIGGLSGPAKVKDAVTKFQKFVGIPETGVVDAMTAEFMVKPRCGMRDIPNGNGRKRRYLLHGSKWEDGLNKKLTWALENNNNDGMPADKVLQLLRKAFGKWAQVADLKFIELSGKPINTALIRVRFVELKHADRFPFDGVGGTLAHAFYPLSNEGFSGDIHFDDAEVFTDDPNAGRNKRKFLWVAVHEIGHSIGLQHSDKKGAIMFPYYNHFKGNDFNLTHDDIEGIQTIYGGNLDVGPPHPRKSTTTKAPTTTPPMECPDVLQAAYLGYFTNQLYVINNDKFYSLFKYSDGVEKGPLPVNTIFKEISKIDTVFRRSDGYLVIFHDDKFSIYNESPIRVRHPRLINNGFQNINAKLENIDTAFIWPENNKLYIFKGEYYWRLSQLPNMDFLADYGYPQNIATKWLGLPKTIDAVFQWTNGEMYFTKGQFYYRWNKHGRKVHNGYPIKLSRSFLNCQAGNAYQ